MRYVAKISFYIHSDSDENAFKEAENVCKKININDNHAIIDEIYIQPFGKLTSKKITK